ncbi:mucin TcMUCII [Trypanosoma cruzi]|nr:mucin TcMUCII [Trypanosoma cruzi]
MCMRWSLVCRSCLLLPLPSVCRAWCAAYGACLAAALSSCGVPSVCVCCTSRLPCCSPCPSLCRSAPHHRTTTLTMTTCRLLCALLVLALCCCPSVCAAESTQPEVKAPVAANPQSPPSVIPSQGTSQSGLPSNGSGAEKGITAGVGPSSTAASPESVDVSNTLRNHDTDGNPGPEIGTRQSAEEANQEAEDPAEKTTTTTTTKAPTTITTTTTKAPTTTTEAPTTTTTRAPSRLREIDGSLSGSACVCASLLLAASALAYTTLG